MPSGDYKNLIVWRKSMDLAKSVYQATSLLPSLENFGLKSQMQRAAVSIPSNIAEGSKRGTRNDFAHFLRIAHGSLAELETQIYLIDVLYPKIPTEFQKSLIQEVGRMLFVMIRKLS